MFLIPNSYSRYIFQLLTSMPYPLFLMPISCFRFLLLFVTPISHVLSNFLFLFPSYDFYVLVIFRMFISCSDVLLFLLSPSSYADLRYPILTYSLSLCHIHSSYSYLLFLLLISISYSYLLFRLMIPISYS